MKNTTPQSSKPLVPAFKSAGVVAPPDKERLKVRTQRHAFTCASVHLNSIRRLYELP